MGSYSPVEDHVDDGDHVGARNDLELEELLGELLELPGANLFSSDLVVAATSPAPISSFDFESGFHAFSDSQRLDLEAIHRADVLLAALAAHRLRPSGTGCSAGPWVGERVCRPPPCPPLPPTRHSSGLGGRRARARRHRRPGGPDGRAGSVDDDDLHVRRALGFSCSAPRKSSSPFRALLAARAQARHRLGCRGRRRYRRRLPAGRARATMRAGPAWALTRP